MTTNLAERPSLPKLLKEIAATDPTRHYLEDVTGMKMNVGETQAYVTAWASLLQSIGAKPGDTVVSMLPNSLTNMGVWIGTAWLRALEVPVNTAYRGPMLAHALAVTKARIAVIHERFLPRLLELEPAESEAITQLVVVREADHDPLPLEPRQWQVTEVLANVLAGPLADVATIDLESLTPPEDKDICTVMFTSGTTGPSKAVLCVWGQLFTSTLGHVPIEDFGPEDAWYSPFPMFHLGGKFPPYLMLLCGGRLVMRDGFSGSAFMDDVERHLCTAFIFFDIGFLAQFDDDRIRASTMKKGIPGSRQIVREKLFSLGIKTSCIFSMTELSIPIWSNGWIGPDYPYNSSGQVREGFQCRLVDDDDNEVAIGEVGELVVRTDRPWTIMQGYLNMPEATVQAWRNQWFHTGDLLRKDAEGYFYFVDRKKDSIRHGGENVSSVEVEMHINNFPGIIESAAVAVPRSSFFGDDDIRVMMVVEKGTNIDFERLASWCEKLPKFMIPRFFEITNDPLPRTPTQKIRRQAVRDRAMGPDVWDRREFVKRQKAG